MRWLVSDALAQPATGAAKSEGGVSLVGSVDLTKGVDFGSPLLLALLIVILYSLLRRFLDFNIAHADERRGEDDHARVNEFWSSYGQIVISLFLIMAVSVLLILRVISAEAGLPILSGISGFAIGRGGARDGKPGQPPKPPDAPDPAPAADAADAPRG
jgi:small-conductance mechanosensitive channel